MADRTEAPPSINELTCRSDYVAAATRTSIEVAQAHDIASMHLCFQQGIHALGAERAWFASVACSKEGFDALCVQSACDVSWVRRYLDEERYRSDAWLDYAGRHGDPIAASQLKGLTFEQQRTQELAAEAGFVSCALVPVHTARHTHRFGLLVLGHSAPTYFEGEGFEPFKVVGTLLALQLHNWWIARYRREKLAHVQLSDDDLALLDLYLRGQSSEQIAVAFQLSKKGVDSRFRRLNERLKVSHRRDAAQLAVDCGLILNV